MATKIPIEFVCDRGALSIGEAAVYLGVGHTTLWQLRNLPKSNPRRIRATSYNRIPKAELDRHLEAEMERER